MYLLVLTDAILAFTARSAIAEWDLDETKPGGPFKEILDYDILVNCILLMEVYSFGRLLVFVMYLFGMSE